MDSTSSTAVRENARTTREAGGAEFSEIYRRYFGFAWASLRRLGVPASSIDDAAQDFWVTVHRRLATLDPDASIKAWLFGVARRIASHHRRRDFRNRRKLAALGEATSSRVDRSLQRHDVAMSLEVALEQLDEPKRTAFVLSELEGWSAPEIARAVGSKPNTIYSRIRLAKEQLRKHLDEAGDAREVEELAEQTREATLAPAGASKRCLAAISPKLALAAPTAAATPAVASGLAQLKLALVGAGLGAAVVAGVYVTLPDAVDPPPASVAKASPSPRAGTSERRPIPSPAPAAVMQPPVQPAEAWPAVQPATPVSRSTPRAAAATKPASPDRLEQETRLLSAAQRDLRAGRTSTALALVAQHQREHPQGKLAHLRAVLEVEALCAEGRKEEARQRATTALAKSPPSKVAQKLAAACSKSD